MIEKIGHIKNPLTIIAIFAGLAEISGTIVLPFIDKANQGIFIWFLIIFPALIVILFFLTLNFNHRVLYAPSDFRNEDNFLAQFQKSDPKARVERIKEEIEESMVMGDRYEVSTQLSSSKSDQETEHTQPIKTNQARNLQATYFLSEELIIKKLSIELGIDFQREVTYKRGNEKYDFDGVAAQNDSLTIIEVKYMKTPQPKSLSFPRLLDNVQDIYFSLTNNQKNNFKFILAIGTDLPKEMHPEIMKNLSELIGGYIFNSDIRIYNLTELEKEFGLIES